MSPRRLRDEGRLDQRLLAGLLGAGAAALGGHAEAAQCNPPGVLTGSVCHTDLGPGVFIGNDSAYNFDFDHDGDAELRLRVNPYGYVYYYAPFAPHPDPGPDAIAAVVGGSVPPKPTPLLAGDQISLANATHAVGFGVMEGWAGLGPRHLGAKIQLSEGTAHLGWARLTVVTSAPQHSTLVTVHGFAFRVTPGAPIEAGQSTPVELQSFDVS